MGYLACVQRLPTWVPVSPRLCLDSNLPSFGVSGSTGERLSYTGLSGFPLSIPQGQQSPMSSLLPPGMSFFFTELLLYEAGPGPSEQQSFEILRLVGGLHTSSLGTRLVTSGHIALKPTVPTAGLQ